jgi:hypothetical protein
LFISDYKTRSGAVRLTGRPQSYSRCYTPPIPCAAAACHTAAEQTLDASVTIDQEAHMERTMSANPASLDGKNVAPWKLERSSIEAVYQALTSVQ